ncbi:MAG: ribosome maturation factor RimP [Pseudomonadota bacterium]
MNRPHEAFCDKDRGQGPHLADDDRLIKETGLEAQVAHIVIPSLGALGFRLVRVRITGANGCTVQVMAERDDGTFTIEDCQAASEAISPALDVEDPIGRAYHLEMSSPGIDRPLVRVDDFVRAAGHEAKLETSLPIDGRRRFRGTLMGVSEGAVTVRLADMGNPKVAVPLSEISDARLILTDELIKDSLKRGKQAAEAQTANGSADNVAQGPW